MLGIEEVLCELKEDINEQGLPPGFRFHPTDEELITFYLASKVFDAYSATINIAQVDLNRCEPWDLPDMAKMGEREWYFFSLRDRKYPTGLRTNRATGAGYWKATGKDREVYNTNNVLVGMKKTLVFYKGRAPRGEKTRWVMHEYRLEGQFSCRQTCKEEWVICRIFHKIKDKKPPILYQGRNQHHHHYMSSSSYFAGPSSPSDITNTLPPLPALLESEPDAIFQNMNNHNNNNSTFSINDLQLPSTTTPLATYTQNKRDSKTNNSYPSQSNVLIKSLLSNQICPFEQEDPTPTANTIPIQCKTETSFSSLFPLLLPPQHANLRWGCDQQLHHDFSGLDFTALGFSPLGPTGPTRTTTSSTSFDFSKAFGSAPSAAVRESWPLDI